MPDHPEDTRVTGRLPGLEIEVRHRNDPAEGAEYLAVTLKATPSLDAVSLWLDPYRMALAMNPWLAVWRAWGWPVPSLAQPEPRERSD